MLVMPFCMKTDCNDVHWKNIDGDIDPIEDGIVIEINDVHAINDWTPHDDTLLVKGNVVRLLHPQKAAFPDYYKFNNLMMIIIIKC